MKVKLLRNLREASEQHVIAVYDGRMYEINIWDEKYHHFVFPLEEDMWSALQFYSVNIEDIVPTMNVLRNKWISAQVDKMKSKKALKRRCMEFAGQFKVLIAGNTEVSVYGK